ncbi:hypothetical protein D3C87_2182120 [compost metagenome]
MSRDLSLMRMIRLSRSTNQSCPFWRFSVSGRMSRGLDTGLGWLPWVRRREPLSLESM